MNRLLLKNSIAEHSKLVSGLQKSFLPIIRADSAHIQNDVLAKNGFSIRVDHRSLMDQKEEAERNGDFFLSRLFNRVPEKYIGVISSQEDDNPQRAKLKKFHALRFKHFETVLKMDLLSKEFEELETKDAVQSSSLKAKKLIDSIGFDSSDLQALSSNLFTAN